jgi:hypothetical protein
LRVELFSADHDSFQAPVPSGSETIVVVHQVQHGRPDPSAPQTFPAIQDLTSSTRYRTNRLPMQNRLGPFPSRCSRLSKEGLQPIRRATALVSSPAICSSAFIPACLLSLAAGWCYYFHVSNATRKFLDKEGRMTCTIETEIKWANAFGDHCEDLVIARAQVPSSERNNLLMAYWSLVLEFHRGILCLISQRFFGAAFALVRPLVEATVRSHVTIMGADQDVSNLRKDEYRTNFASVGREIDTVFGTGELFQRFLADGRKAFHSFTHAGMSQVGRRFSGADLAASYEEGAVLEVIRISTSAVFIVNNLVTKHFGFEEEWKKNTDLYAEWGNRA